MKVKILKAWIRYGRIMQPGEVIDLPEDQAARALERGLASRQSRKAVGRGKPGGRKSA